jgi:hypothetical protein
LVYPLIIEADQSRDPEGPRKRKIDKLTPVGSQSEYYSRDEIARDDEMGVYDTNICGATDIIEEDDSQDCMIIESVDLTTNRVPANNVNKNSAKRSLALDTSERPQKRPDRTSEGISDDVREQTVQSLLESLRPLIPPENVPNLIDSTATRLESGLFNRISNDRRVNTLGRSSTLTTAGRKQDLLDRYLREKEVLLQKVGKYVEIGTKDDVELEQLQQGEIWEVIKDIISGNS